MQHQTPSGFPGNFRKRKVLGTLWFPSGLPETPVQAKCPVVAARKSRAASRRAPEATYPGAHSPGPARERSRLPASQPVSPLGARGGLSRSLLAAASHTTNVSLDPRSVPQTPLQPVPALSRPRPAPSHAHTHSARASPPLPIPLPTASPSPPHPPSRLRSVAPPPVSPRPLHRPQSPPLGDFIRRVVGVSHPSRLPLRRLPTLLPPHAIRHRLLLLARRAV